MSENQDSGVGGQERKSHAMACKDCKWWKSTDGEFGECCRHAPKPYLSNDMPSDDKQMITVWPQTYHEDFCGDFSDQHCCVLTEISKGLLESRNKLLDVRETLTNPAWTRYDEFWRKYTDEIAALDERIDKISETLMHPLIVLNASVDNDQVIP